MTPFAEWLEGELRVRGLNHGQLAAYIERKPQTVSGWQWSLAKRLLALVVLLLTLGFYGMSQNLLIIGEKAG